MNIIWDWNGTLLNDVDICVKSMNHLLEKRNLPLLDINRYKTVFGFPVKDYYAKIGFDFTKENFEIPANEYMDWFHSYLPEAKLFSGAERILAFFKKQGYNQYILSAMEEKSLIINLREKGILNYFVSVAGMGDVYANGKSERGKEMMTSLSVNPDEAILIGDTIHDWEVAKELGIRSLLLASGHQLESRLREKTENVVCSYPFGKLHPAELVKNC